LRKLAEGHLVWVVRLLRPLSGLPAGAVVGTTSFLDVSIDDARLEVGATAYTPLVWSTRVNPDTKLQLLSCAFETLGAGRVALKTDVRNCRSQRAIARLGALHEGTLRRHKRRADATIRDSVLFSIIAEDWPAVKAGLLARVS
jgi:RimJ/RimL family protein N-acetyltransferase